MIHAIEAEILSILNDVLPHTEVTSMEYQMSMDTIERLMMLRLMVLDTGDEPSIFFREDAEGNEVEYEFPNARIHPEEGESPGLFDMFENQEEFEDFIRSQNNNIDNDEDSK